MATNFPTSADDATTVGGDSLPAAGTALSDSTAGHPSHSDLHENVGDAVQAVEAKIGTGSSTPAANTVLTGTGSGTSGWATVDRAMITADAIDGTKIADDAIDSEHYVDGSIDRVHLAADIIDGTKLADDAVDSEHYVDGSIDRVHLAADIVDGTKIADDSIDSEHYVDGSIDTAHLADDAVTAAKIADGAVGDDQLIDAPTFTTVTATDITLGGQDLGEIQTYDPTWTNVTNDFESVGAYYAYVKDMVYVSIEAELSASTGIGDVRVSLPVAASDTHQASNSMLQVQLFDYDTNVYYQGMATPVNATTIQVRRLAVSGSNLIGGPTSSTLPHTWADGDKILITGFYRVGS